MKDDAWDFSLPRTLLRAELLRRCEKNPKYSLRAFARSLGMSHSVLSLVLSGKRSLSRKATQEIAERLAWNPKVRAQIAKARAFDATFDRAARAAGRQMTPEEFDPISDWYYDAILCLLNTPAAKFESAWISARLGIPVEDARTAIARLKELGLVSYKDKRWRPVPITPTGTHTTTSIKKYHRQYLTRALESLEKLPFDTRSFASIMIATNPDFFPYARRRIEKFCRELSEELESMGTPTEVYKLMIQFFPLTVRGRDASERT